MNIEAQITAAHDEHLNAIFRFCYVHLGDREKAKDATQETFVRTWKYLAKGKTIEHIKPFLYRTARNILVDLSRQPRQDSLDTLQEKGFDVAGGQDPAILAEANHAIRLTHLLDDQYRDAVLLRYVEGMTPKEIASITDESEDAISVRIHRGIEKLRELLVQKI